MTEASDDRTHRPTTSGTVSPSLRPATRLVSVWLVAMALGVLVLGLLVVVLSPDTFVERLLTAIAGMAWTAWLIVVVGGQADRRDDTPQPPPPAGPDVVDRRTLTLERQNVALARRLDDQQRLLEGLVVALDDVLKAVESGSGTAEAATRTRRLAMPGPSEPPSPVPLVHWPVERDLHDWPQVVRREDHRIN
jgi:hypothetical protein